MRFLMKWNRTMLRMSCLGDWFIFWFIFSLIFFKQNFLHFCFIMLVTVKMDRTFQGERGGRTCKTCQRLESALTPDMVCTAPCELPGALRLGLLNL